MPKDFIAAVAAGQEKLITLAEAAKLPLLQRNGRPAHVSKMYRLIRCKDPLDHLIQNGVAMTSSEAVERFIRRHTFGPDAPMPVRLSPRRRSHDEAKRELESSGYRKKAS